MDLINVTAVSAKVSLGSHKEGGKENNICTISKNIFLLLDFNNWLPTSLAAQCTWSHLLQQFQLRHIIIPIQ